MNENRNSYLQDVKEVPYPPAPWKCSGQMWTGLFKSETPRQLPKEFKHLLNPNLFIVSLIRYLEGTLRYDELILATPARIGFRVGLYVNDIWVDDLASLWGGRRIWGLPKNLAEFKWNNSTVQITDDLGSITKISVDTSPTRSPLLWTPVPGFGSLDGNWTHYLASLWMHPGKTNMQISEWNSARFGNLKSNTPSVSIAARPFAEMQVPVPKIFK